MGLLIRKGETGFLLAFCYQAEYPPLSAIPSKANEYAVFPFVSNKAIAVGRPRAPSAAPSAYTALVPDNATSIAQFSSEGWC